MTFPRHRALYEDVYRSLMIGMQRFLGPLELALLVVVPGSDEIHGVDRDNLLNSLGITAKAVAEACSMRNGTKQMPELGPYTHLVKATLDHSRAVIWVVRLRDARVFWPIVEAWLQEAASQLRPALSTIQSSESVRSTARDTLLTFAPSAVKRALSSVASEFVIKHPVDIILDLSLAYEEGRKCSGSIIFLNLTQVPIGLFKLSLAAESRVPIVNTKHVRKLIASVDASPFAIATNSQQIVGIVDSTDIDEQQYRELVDSSLKATFNRGRADITLGGTYVCSAYEGQVQCRTVRLYADAKSPTVASFFRAMNFALSRISPAKLSAAESMESTTGGGASPILGAAAATLAK